MGSAVFHGGFSTLLAISVLGNSNSYIFEAFFKCWFAIITFGMANGFFLLPVILAYCGPIDELIEDKKKIERDLNSYPNDQINANRDIEKAEKLN